MSTSRSLYKLDTATFTCFSKLPKELRLAVWKLTFIPRKVEIQGTNGNRNEFISTATSPAALMVCRESRSFASRFYALCFGSVWYPPKVRFNTELDTLCIIGRSGAQVLPYLFATMASADVSGLCLAINLDAMAMLHPGREPGFERMLKTLCLKELIFYYDFETLHHLNCRVRDGLMSCMMFSDDKPLPTRVRTSDETSRDQYFLSDGWDFIFEGSYPCRRTWGLKQCQRPGIHTTTRMNKEEFGDEGSPLSDDHYDDDDFNDMY